ncbi:MAG: type III ribulose-bisphosphate carboxylase [Candidatus Aenigmarchaeota archaeon]|nr:type III ribulose-bisphosphate carboxylase [Candidatus Aenigmarchaeota archaeon]
MSYQKYIDLGYKPSKDDLVCTFKIKPGKGVSRKSAIGAVAAESSTGTWTKLTTMDEGMMAKLGAKVFWINGKYAKIAYPCNLFEKGNMPQILSSIAGNIFNMKEVSELRLEDVRWPKKIMDSFKGPKFGVKGIRKLLKVKKRPLCGTIVKPKLGLNEKQHAKVAYESWKGGVDIVKDDENLTSQPFNKFNKRIVETLRLRDKVEKETGEKKIYMPNVTAETNEMIKRAEFVKRKGGEYIMVDILTVGWSALQTLRNKNFGMVIHAHRAMHGALTRNKNHGISMMVLAEAARMIGVDQLHIGTAVGKMDETEREVIDINKKINGSMGKLKPVFSVCSGGLHPGHVPKLVKMLGKDIICQFGGGVHGHPKGTEAGAKAVRQAIDATMKGISLKDYAKKYKELGAAIKKWI